MDGPFHERFGALIETYRANGLRDHHLVNDYLKARDAELVNVPNKESENYKLYDYMEKLEKTPGMYEVFLDQIFNYLESRARNRFGKVFKLK